METNDGDHDWIPERPKGMWQRTCDRLAAKMDRVVRLHDGVLQ